jgi:hypothetical protein
MAVVVAPTQAYPHYRHEVHYRHEAPHHHVVRAWQHRDFCSWAEANAWIRYQRLHGSDVRYEWHGPNVWVYYR